MNNLDYSYIIFYIHAMAILAIFIIKSLLKLYYYVSLNQFINIKLYLFKSIIINVKNCLLLNMQCVS